MQTNFKSILFLFNLSLSFSVACQNSSSDPDKKTTSIPVKEEKKTLTIDIQPFTDISKTQADYIFSELKKLYPYVELKRSIAFPVSAFYPKRNRYRADSLLGYLDRITANEHVTIGLTNKDISTNKGTIEDWGVMGLGFCPGNACICSSFRLSKKDQLRQLFKVSIHELGHTQGLEHCPVRTCFMRDAEGKNSTGEEKEFCPACKSKLMDKGWTFQY